MCFVKSIKENVFLLQKCLETQSTILMIAILQLPWHYLTRLKFAEALALVPYLFYIALKCKLLEWNGQWLFLIFASQGYMV